MESLQQFRIYSASIWKQLFDFGHDLTNEEYDFILNFLIVEFYSLIGTLFKYIADYVID